ncbi:MAG: hypothetical protein IPL61_15565 [Myxococcales bacterium]|nr:hypothetical protein [Myxococcales bacterium]
MSGVPSYVAAFEQLRPAILARLVEVRASLDHAIARTTPDEARLLFEGVLHALSTLLVTGDHTLHRGFLHSFIAVRSAEGIGPDHAQRLLVAIADVAGALARSQYPHDPSVALAINHAARLTARMVNDVIAEELGRRVAQLPAPTAPAGARR